MRTICLKTTKAPVRCIEWRLDYKIWVLASYTIDDDVNVWWIIPRTQFGTEGKIFGVLYVQVVAKHGSVFWGVSISMWSLNIGQYFRGSLFPSDRQTGDKYLGVYISKLSSVRRTIFWRFLFPRGHQTGSKYLGVLYFQVVAKQESQYYNVTISKWSPNRKASIITSLFPSGHKRPEFSCHYFQMVIKVRIWGQNLKVVKVCPEFRGHYFEVHKSWPIQGQYFQVLITAYHRTSLYTIRVSPF